MSDLLPVSFIAQLVDYRTGIVEVMASNPVGAFWALFVTS